MTAGSLPMNSPPPLDDFLARGARRRANSAAGPHNEPLSPISAFVRNSLNTQAPIVVQNPVSLRGAPIRSRSSSLGHLTQPARGPSPGANVRELSREELVHRSREVTEWFRETKTINQMARPVDEMQVALADARRRRTEKAAQRASSEASTRTGSGIRSMESYAETLSNPRMRSKEAYVETASNPRMRSKEAPAPPPGPELTSGAERGRENEEPRQEQIQKRKSLMEKFGYGAVLKTAVQEDEPQQQKGQKFFNVVKEVSKKQGVGFAEASILPENNLLERLRRLKSVE